MILGIGSYSKVDITEWEERTDFKVLRWCECDLIYNQRDIDRAIDHVFEVKNRLDPRRGKVHLLQPYAFDESKATKLSAWCNERNLRWRCWGGAGFWDPRTISILVFKNYPTPKLSAL